MSEIRVAMTIAGSDSGGGAGIQADLKSFAAFGCFGTSAITAITCQNSHGVSAVEPVTAAIVAGQCRAILDDFPVAAAKSGMLFSAEIVESVAAIWRELDAPPPLVVDPVMVSTSGHRLLNDDARAALARLLPLATLVTPNLPEAHELLLLSGCSADYSAELTRPEMAAALAHHLARHFGVAILLKGGHRLADDVSLNESVDLLSNGKTIRRYTRPRVVTQSSHGTGCTLSAAITAALARGADLEAAIDHARDYLQSALEEAPLLGSGPARPLWHQNSYRYR